ncbi:MAG: glycosyltransferase WbuB [Mesorhizobium sp.]|uniref:glycosyltransferase family 4 protein n=1 Tax=Mesorhizobium sp. TaxID=1871066 RepID=UPI000FE67F46|nr:glycosyltransferase family 4 protein [Mesorhizobium sp.]RWP42691.1 MAG: glycosyltransferase WbuB [Mesorhizobium sp.]
MHILFLTDNFPPEVNAPASRTFEHCREWVRAGHKVTVVTCAPNFPRGQIFDGYRNRLWQEEEMAGIRVIRVWSYITANEGFARRVADYISYMVTATLAAPFVRGVDLVIGTSPQFFTACAAYTASRLKRIPFVFELRDLWPESIRAVGAMKQSPVLDWLECAELFLYRKASLIVSVTNSFRENLAARGIDTSKVRVITNGVDATRFHPRAKDQELVRHYSLEGKFVAGYIGTHGMAHALETVLDAADWLRQRPGGDAFHFLLLGDGASKPALMAQARERSLHNVIFVDTVSKDEVVRYWSLLDASIIHLKKSDLFRSVIPSKLFESMGMGIPVLLGVEGESADIVLREDVGLVFAPENSRALCRQLEELLDNTELRQRLSLRGPAAAARYDRTNLATEMLGYLQGLRAI